MTKLSERLEALAEKATNMCEACGGAGGFEAGGPICCNGSDWECGASGCTGPIDGRYLEQCSVCLGTGQRSPHNHRSTESERPMTQDKETLREAVARAIDACDPDRIDHALCLRQADAAIATMFERLRTPSDGMIEAGESVFDAAAYADLVSQTEVWQAMLTAFQQENSDA